MFKKCFAAVLAASMLAGTAVFPVGAEEEKLSGFLVSSDQLIESSSYSAKNLTDGDETTAALLKNPKNAELLITFSEQTDVSGVRISKKSFPAWQDIREIQVQAGDQTALLKFYGSADAAEIKTDFSGIRELKLSVSGLSGKEGAPAAMTEITLFGAGYAEEEETSKEPRELEFNVDFRQNKNSGDLGGWEYALSRCYDKNSTTVGGISNVADGFMMYQFLYPTDVTRLGFMNMVNGDWATPKNFQLYVYNEDVVFRNKLKNPEPITDGKIYTLENTGAWQYIDLEGDLYKGITHLYIDFLEGYITSTGAKWGGWHELEVDGIPYPEKRPTTEIIATTLRSNVDLLCEMGVADGEPTEEFMEKTPTRLDMAKALLHLTGEYEKALSYCGTYNFQDADEENYNLLSYIYAYKCFGIEGDGNDNFCGNDPLTARACYKILLSLLDYECGKDYTWDNMESLLYKIGIGDMIYEPTFTNKDMCNAIYEAFTMNRKGSDKKLLEELHESGIISEHVWAGISDKEDKVSVITDGDYTLPEDTPRDSTFTFTNNEAEHEIVSSSFCYNAPFHYAGIYYGTLPKSDPRSKRDEFAAALKKAGGRSLRFPGGLPCHQYFMEGEEYAIQYDMAQKNGGRGDWLGLYNSEDYNNAWYVDFWDMLEFCREYDVDLLFQTNPGFFVDKNGKVRQAYPCFNVKNTDNGLITNPNLYDHNRIEEAIEAFDKNLDEIVRRGYEIKYWEIGNEDNFKSYSSLPLTDIENPLTRDFLQATEGYIRSIKKHFPDAWIIAPGGFPYEKMSKDAYAMLDSTATHYPFGQWTIPPLAENASAARLARTNEQNFPRNGSKEQRNQLIAEGKPIRDDTETMAWRFEGWDPNSLEHTFANALNTAHNWGELVFDSGFTNVNVMHDLESPWFGHIIYDVSMDPGNRYFTWNRGINYTVHKDDIPDLFKFKDAYYFNPSTRAFELLSRHIGGRVLTNAETNVARRLSGYASIKDNELTFTIVNRFAEPMPVQIQLPNLTVPAQTATAEVLQSDYLRAVLEQEYHDYEEEIPVAGNEENSEGFAIAFEAKQNSVVHFTVTVKQEGIE